MALRPGMTLRPGMALRRPPSSKIR